MNSRQRALAIAMGWLVLVHLSGAIGLALAPSFFLRFTALNLLLSSGILLLFQRALDVRFGVMFVLTAFAGWFAEAIGVNTGWLFGDYSYGRTFGIQFIGVPMLIGLNWAVLVLAALQVIRYSWGIRSRWKAALLSGILLVALDLLMERPAPKLDFWTFYEGRTPQGYPGVHNFIGWFAVGTVISWIAFPEFTRKRNGVAKMYLIIQAAFFALLNLIL